jgi:hypothetical protein
MKAKKGDKNQKNKGSWIGKWLKWYFEKRTCRKWNQWEKLMLDGGLVRRSDFEGITIENSDC